MRKGQAEIFIMVVGLIFVFIVAAIFIILSSGIVVNTN
jgi:uncharacterized protein YpmB